MIRFSKKHPCPICSGYEEAARGKRERCWGFYSDDGEFAHCTREEYAGGLSRNSDSEAYPHKLTGFCGCGRVHGAAVHRNASETIYPYRDTTGVIRYEVVRKNPKGFFQRRHAPENWQTCAHRKTCGKADKICRDGYIWSLAEKPCSPAIERVLYRLPELLADRHQRPEEPVHIASGEKDVDTLRKLGYVATTNPEGEGCGKWRDPFNQYLQDAHLIIHEDNDDTGKAHVLEVAASVYPHAASVKIVTYRDLAEHGDVSDFLMGGKTADDLSQRIENTALWQPFSPPETPETNLQRIVTSSVGGCGFTEITFASLRTKAQEDGIDVRVLPFLGQSHPEFFAEGQSHILASGPKTGKTTLLVRLVRDWAQACHHILYLSEEPEIIWKRRLIEEDEGEWLERVVLMCCLGQPLANLQERMKNGNEDIVILDTSKILGLEDENDSATVNAALTPWIVGAREKEKTFILAHHTTKGGGKAVESVAGSHCWAAVFDTILEIMRDDHDDTQRMMRGVGRLLPAAKTLYGMKNGTLVNLGSPADVEFAGVRDRLLEVLPMDWIKTAEIRAAIGEPVPSSELVRQVLVELAKVGDIERDPPLNAGSQGGKTYRWRRTNQTSYNGDYYSVGGLVEDGNGLHLSETSATTERAFDVFDGVEPAIHETPTQDKASLLHVSMVTSPATGAEIENVRNER